MKKIFTLSIIIFLMALTFLNAQIVTDKSFKTLHPRTEISRGSSFFETDSILPITLKQKISGLSVSGSITFTGEKGFVRIVLTDNYENDYLVLETNTIFENKTSVSFDEFCEETALLNNFLPKQIIIECTDAQVTITGIQYAVSNEYQTSRSKQIREEQLDVKLQHINAVLAQKEITWGAGKTSLSQMSYMEKKSLFGGQLPNLAGFDYYVSGIYVMQGHKPNHIASLRSVASSQFVPEFDWRNRHGRNWITSVKQQGCSDCWVFSVVGATEAYVNLYYNQLLNLDLSEQDVLSCSGGGDCKGGWTVPALNYIKNIGVVNETCFPYAASYLPCGNKCSKPPYERINIGNHTSFNPYFQTSDDLKKFVIQAPMSFGINCWGHTVCLVGYKRIQLGDSIYIKTPANPRWVTIYSGDPLIGSDAWIVKNSNGTSWGDNGFGYMVTDWLQLYHVNTISGNITSLNYTDADIVCEDRDGDGYYYWGIGPKPATCPSCAPDEPDGDDSDSTLGPMDEYGNCAAITPLVDNITTSQTWDTNKTLCRSIAIPSGVTLTITADVLMYPVHKITIQNGGKLILSGGTIDNGSIVAQNGSELTISNNGKILLGSYDNFDIQLGAVFKLVYGKVSLK